MVLPDKLIDNVIYGGAYSAEHLAKPWRNT